MLPSVVLQNLHDAAPERATVGWVLRELDNESFGLVLLLLAIAAVVPGICSLAGLLTLICAPQMVVGRPTLVFPQWIANRSLPDRQLRATVPHLIVALRFAERIIRPRWRKPGKPTTRFVGVILTLLSILLVAVPIPFSNIVPAMIMALISLAYLEGDGLFLSLGLLAGLVMIGVDAEILGDIVRNRLKL